MARPEVSSSRQRLSPDPPDQRVFGRLKEPRNCLSVLFVSLFSLSFAVRLSICPQTLTLSLYTRVYIFAYFTDIHFLQSPFLCVHHSFPRVHVLEISPFPSLYSIFTHTLFPTFVSVPCICHVLYPSVFPCPTFFHFRLRDAL